MDVIKQYVDKLFKNYGNTKQIRELKAEIMSNMEAKRDDLLGKGMDEVSAIKLATSSIRTIDDLVEDKIRVDYLPYQIERTQITLIGLLIAWIFSIPGVFFRPLWVNSLLLFAAVGGIGMFYLTLLMKAKQSQKRNIRSISMLRLVRVSKWAWVISLIFIGISTAVTTGIFFSSNIWFSRPVIIDGPYQLATVLSHYFAPLFVLIIPIILTKIRFTWKKYEV